MSAPNSEEEEARMEHLCTRIVREFEEMPGLCLTASQASRLWGLEADRCLELLQRLVAAGRLRRLQRGAYVAA